MSTKLPFLIPNYSDTNPAAPSGARNFKWQEGSQYPDPDGSGNMVADLSGYLAEEIVLGFVIVAGAGGAGTNVAPMLVAPRAASVTKCKVVVKAADATVDFVFKIKKNGTDVFSADPSVTHGTSSGTVLTFTSLTSSPLAVAADDVFSIDITTGSATWALTIQLET